MQNKLILIIGVVLIFFSMQASSQITIDTVKSVHPKMDKYYPQPLKTRVIYAADSNTKSTPKPITQVQPAPTMTTTPTTQNTVVNPAPQVQQTLPSPSEPETTPAPAVTSTPVAVEPSNTTVNNTTTVTTPAAVTVNKPVQPKPAPAVSHYVDPASLFTTRLGSSSPQYDTWEKNNNGAGSVTTNSK
ncbi:MAG TPA: hypothetical protein VFT78_08585 [Hanamia sp.]|nr:hypothetical protein [Hanamia sp.]